MKNALRELRELDRQLRCVAPGTTNIGMHVKLRAEMIAPLLRVHPDDLRGLAHRSDEEIAPRLRELVKEAVLRQREGVRVHRHERAYQAASALGASVRHSACGAVLDADLLLGELLADLTRKYILFQGEGVYVVVERHTLAKAAWLRRLHLDVGARVHADGLHLRWRGGRGGLNLRSVPVPKSEAANVLVVSLPAATLPPTERPHSAWLGEIIRGLGYVT
jgi:DNA-binding IclR family transcriptional regulator